MAAIGRGHQSGRLRMGHESSVPDHHACYGGGAAGGVRWDRDA